MLFYLFQTADVGIDGHRIIRIIDDESGFCAAWFFDVLSLQIVDFHLFLFPSFGIIGGQPGGLLKGAVGQLFSFRPDDDVGTGNSFGMEPPIVSSGKLEG